MAQVTTSVKGLSKERLKGGHQKETKIIWESETELMMEDLSGQPSLVKEGLRGSLQKYVQWFDDDIFKATKI